MDLFVIRRAIDAYSQDQQDLPGSLQALVDKGYLRSIPVDPITGRKDWVAHFRGEACPAPQSNCRIKDVSSHSDSISTDGSAYSAW